MRKSDSNTAGPQGAGYIFQLERALHHLATASSVDDVVAVEHFDDVAVLQNDKLILVEQDKSTTNNRKKIINDRSRALWRTLQIWLQIRETAEGADCKRHLLFLNVWQPSPLIVLLRDRISKKIDPIFILDELRKIGKKKNEAKIDTIISDVMSRNDSDIISLIERIEIVVANDYNVSRATIANGFALHPYADAELVIDGLLGWLTMKARIHWSERKGALISRREVLLQCHALQDKQRKSRFLPRASSEIEINPGAHEKALTRNFVEHLARISADNEDVVQAIDHFLKFSAEKY